MKLRKLKPEDASYMLEWMHDDSVARSFNANFAEKTLDDCCTFIRSAQEVSENIHLAVVNNNDEYMGTVSLKHIEPNGYAEFAIAVRKCAMGKGYSAFAIHEMISYGFQTLGLKCIYWCVAADNARAIKFYDKNDYKRIAPERIKASLQYTDEQIRSYIWYAAVGGETE